MAAPNIVGVTSIIGLTTAVSGISSTASTVILSNAASSNLVFKLNTLFASNSTSNATTVTVKFFNGAAGAGTSVAIASTITIPTGSSLVIVGKDNPIYIEENRSIGAQAGAGSAIDIVASYESIG